MTCPVSRDFRNSGRIDRADAGGADGGDHAGRHDAVRDIGFDRGLECGRIEREIVPDGNLAQVFRAQTGDPDAFLGRRMGFARSVGRQRCGCLQSFRIGRPAGRLLPGRQNRAQNGAGRRILYDAMESARQADHLPDPVEDPGFHLRCGRRSLPQHALRAERGRQHLGQHQGGLALAVK